MEELTGMNFGKMATLVIILVLGLLVVLIVTKILGGLS